MKLRRLFMALMALALVAPEVDAHSIAAGSSHKAGSETLLLIPSRGSALIIIENGSRFDPFVQRLIAEGEIRRWFVIDQPLMQIQIPLIQNDHYLNELQIRQLDEMLRR